MLQDSRRFDPEPFQELLLHLAELLQDDPEFEKLKLQNLLFAIDCRSDLELQKPVTNATYIKDPRGVSIIELQDQVDNLFHSQGVRTIVRTVNFISSQTLVAQRPARLNAFTSAELQLIWQEATKFAQLSPLAILETVQDQPAWQAANYGAEITYRQATGR